MLAVSGRAGLPIPRSGRCGSSILHRPGAELQRLTPRNNDKLLFDGLPWVARAQEEHDAFADLLRSRGVEVLLLRDLLTEALSSGAARMHGISAAVDARRLGSASGARAFGLPAQPRPGRRWHMC